MTTSFDVLLKETIRSPDLLASPPDPERKEFDNLSPDIDIPLLLGAKTEISDRAIELIVTFEVTNKATYERLYRHPIWPKGNSGVTIGIGYDAGYVTQEKLIKDWSGVIDDISIKILTQVCGLKGQSAGAAIVSVKEIEIPFSAADTVFKDITLPRTIATTVAALPKSVSLPGDCLGALVSLAYNRGPAFNASGDRYREMRLIRDDIAQNNLIDIPTQFRAMKRLWQGNPVMSGVARRRELEALLFAEGLSRFPA